MGDVVGPDLDAALDQQRGVTQEPMRNAHVGFVPGEEDRVAPEIHLRARLTRELAEELASWTGKGQEY